MMKFLNKIFRTRLKPIKNKPESLKEARFHIKRDGTVINDIEHHFWKIKFKVPFRLNIRVSYEEAIEILKTPDYFSKLTNVISSGNRTTTIVFSVNGISRFNVMLSNIFYTGMIDLLEPSDISKYELGQPFGMMVTNINSIYPQSYELDENFKNKHISFFVGCRDSITIEELKKANSLKSRLKIDTEHAESYRSESTIKHQKQRMERYNEIIPIIENMVNLATKYYE